MVKLRVKDLVDSFEKAIILDIKNEKAYSINDGAVKVYNKKRYDDILSGLSYMDFTGDE